MADPLAPRPLPEIEVDAAAVAQALGLSRTEFQRLMDAGRIRTLTERGTGPELGQYRLSFWQGQRRYRIVTDAEGRVLARETH